MPSHFVSKKSVISLVIALSLMIFILLLLRSKTPRLQVDTHSTIKYSENHQVDTSSTIDHSETHSTLDHSETHQVKTRSTIDYSETHRIEVRDATDPVTQTEALQLRALAIGLQDELQDLVILDDKQQPFGELSLRQFAFSHAFNCPIVDGKLIFGIPDGVDKAGNDRFKPVASVDWKDSYREVCLFFIPKNLIGKNDSTNEYDIQVLDMSNDFEPGHTKILNFTPFDTMVRLGEFKVPIQPWSNSELSIVKELTSEKMAQISVFYQHNDAIHSAQQSRFRYLEDTRYIVLIYPHLKNKRIAVSIVKDFGNLFE